MAAERKVKAPNYSDEQIRTLIADYEAGKTVEEIADAMGRAVKSVRAKLVQLKVYVAPEKAPAVAKDDGPTKKELLATLAELMPEVPIDTIDGLQNATKAALNALIERLESENSVEEDSEEELAA